MLLVPLITSLPAKGRLFPLKYYYIEKPGQQLKPCMPTELHACVRNHNSCLDTRFSGRPSHFPSVPSCIMSSLKLNVLNGKQMSTFCSTQYFLRCLQIFKLNYTSQAKAGSRATHTTHIPRNDGIFFHFTHATLHSDRYFTHSLWQA